MTDDLPIQNGNGKGMACARCDEWIKFRFPRPLKEIAHMTINDEYLTLEPFPVVMYCPSCGTSAETTGRDMTVDLTKQVILFCRLDPVPGDVTPPDYPPDDLA